MNVGDKVTVTINAYDTFTGVIVGFVNYGGMRVQVQSEGQTTAYAKDNIGYSVKLCRVIG
jgi:hypothetical protein